MTTVPEDRLYQDEEDTGIIGFDSLLHKFSIAFHGRMHYFDSYETAEDWYKLNKLGRSDLPFLVAKLCLNIT